MLGSGLQGKSFSESLPARGEPPNHFSAGAPPPARQSSAPARPGGTPARTVQAAGGKLKGLLSFGKVGRELRGILPGGGRASTRRASRERPGPQEEEVEPDAGQGASGQSTPYGAAMHRV